MIVTHQKSIRFNNTCGCVVDCVLLEKAVIWYQDRPTSANKKIYLHGKYPAVSIHRTKIHIHRLLMSYMKRRILSRCEYVHHKDENKLNATITNLEIQDASHHQSITNKGRKQSPSHVERRINATSLTKYGRLVYKPLNLLKT